MLLPVVSSLIFTWGMPPGAAISKAAEGREAEGVAIDMTGPPCQTKVQVVNITE